MKKLLTIFAVLIAFSGVQVFAQQSETYFQVNALLKKGLLKNENEISNLAANLTEQEKNFLYIENEKNSTIPFILNLFLGYGIGSFAQGDTKAGIIGLTGNILGTTLGITGYVLFAPAITYVFTTILTAPIAGLANEQIDFNLEASSAQLITGAALFFTGAAISLGVQIYSWIRPFKYASNYNLKLKNCLSSKNEKLSVQFAPIVDFDNSKYGLLASLKI